MRQVRQRPIFDDPAEAELQVMVANLLDTLGLLWCHVPNGGLRDPATAAILKAQGVKAGVPDVLVFDEPRTAIELKIGNNRPSKEQLVWLAGLRRCGYHVAVCYSLHDVLETLRAQYPGRIK